MKNFKFINSVFVVLILLLLSSNLSFSSDYQFYKSLDESLIRDVELYENELYMLNSNSESFFISKFNFESKSFEIVVPSVSFLMNKVDKVEDMAFYNNDIYIINKNKLINVSDNFNEIILDDKYDNDIHNNFYRKLYNLTHFNGTLYIGSSSVEVESRDTINGTPIEYINSFSEVLILDEKNIKLERVIDSRELEEEINFSEYVSVDSLGNIWFSFMPKEISSGGLAKVNQNHEVEIIDLESYSGRKYILRPASLDFIEGELYISFAPTHESNYLEGLSKYNISSNNWTHSIDFLTNNEERYVGRNWTLPNKALKLKSGELVILSRDLIINDNGEYYYYNIPELQKKKGIENDFYRNLEMFEYKQSKFIVRENGVIEFNSSLTTSVENDITKGLPFQLNSNSLDFKDNELKNYVIYNMVGQKVEEGEFTNSLSLMSLPKGLYIIKINNSIIIKFIVEN